MANPLDMLAREIETVQRGKDINYAWLLEKIRNQAYPREELIEDLKNNKLGYFAKKLEGLYYDTHKEDNG